jgi:hypothetical protein
LHGWGFPPTSFFPLLLSFTLRIYHASLYFKNLRGILSNMRGSFLAGSLDPSLFFTRTPQISCHPHTWSDALLALPFEPRSEARHPSFASFTFLPATPRLRLGWLIQRIFILFGWGPCFSRLLKGWWGRISIKGSYIEKGS